MSNDRKTLKALLDPEPTKLERQDAKDDAQTIIDKLGLPESARDYLVQCNTLTSYRLIVARETVEACCATVCYECRQGTPVRAVRNVTGNSDGGYVWAHGSHRCDAEDIREAAQPAALAAHGAEKEPTDDDQDRVG